MLRNGQRIKVIDTFSRIFKLCTQWILILIVTKMRSINSCEQLMSGHKKNYRRTKYVPSCYRTVWEWCMPVLQRPISASDSFEFTWNSSSTIWPSFNQVPVNSWESCTNFEPVQHASNYIFVRDEVLSLLLYLSSRCGEKAMVRFDAKQCRAGTCNCNTTVWRCSEWNDWKDWKYWKDNQPKRRNLFVRDKLCGTFMRVVRTYNIIFYTRCRVVDATIRAERRDLFAGNRLFSRCPCDIIIRERLLAGPEFLFNTASASPAACVTVVEI